MRLTVHHSAELLPYWLDSLNKLLASDGLNRDKLLNAGHWHVATFNDRVVGLAVTKDEELIYFAVRDATRRRGVGQYLLTETLNWMRTQGWRRFAWYVWDQGPGLPGDWNGRLAPSFEFVFHFNRQARQANKIMPCKFAGQETHLRKDGSSTAMRKKDGTIGGWTAAGTPTQDTKIPDSVIRIMRHKGKIGQDIDHPAVFPVALPEHILETYTDDGDIVFEPFCGSGTTLLAAQRTGRVVRATEIAPEYVDVTVKRFQQNFPEVPVSLVATGQTFDAVAKERLGAPA